MKKRRFVVLLALSVFVLTALFQPMAVFGSDEVNAPVDEPFLADELNESELAPKTSETADGTPLTDEAEKKPEDEGGDISESPAAIEADAQNDETDSKQSV